jgi:hypothetical protein
MRRSSSFSVPEPNDQTSPALQKYNFSGSEKLFLPIEGVKPGTAKKHFFATSKIVFSALPV